MTELNCPFCNIAARKLNAEIVYEDDQILAFKDAHPIAPVHILLIPKMHLSSINDVSFDDANLMGRLIVAARLLAEENNVSESGYRLVFNTGRDANQTIFHIHLHLIGGRFLPFHRE